MGADRYDVVIVGGGSAGCALADRLSADLGTSVRVAHARDGTPLYPPGDRRNVVAEHEEKP